MDLSLYGLGPGCRADCALNTGDECLSCCSELVGGQSRGSRFCHCSCHARRADQLSNLPRGDRGLASPTGQLPTRGDRGRPGVGGGPDRGQPPRPLFRHEAPMGSRSTQSTHTPKCGGEPPRPPPGLHWRWSQAAIGRFGDQAARIPAAPTPHRQPGVQGGSSASPCG